MPILALVGGRPPAVVVDPDRRRLDFASIDGSRVLTWDSPAYVITSGIQGLGVPPRRITTLDFPGLDGQRIGQVSTGPREVVLPFFVSSDDQQVQTHLTQMAAVRAFCDYRSVDYADLEGTFDLVATQQDGQSARRLRCLYVDGMEGVNGVQHGNGSWYSSFDAKLLAVAPYWQGEEWTTPTVVLPDPHPFLANDGPAHPLQLSTTMVLGLGLPVLVPGDVPSPAIVELVGPATSTHITSPSGLDVTVGSLTAGQVFILDTGRSKRATLDGVSAWAKIGVSPQWRPLPPGDASISIAMSDATVASSARVYGNALWETAW